MLHFEVECRELILFITTIFPITAAWARPVKGGISTVVQPDGTTFRAELRGDEWQHWVETLTGYTILKDGDTGYWVYAQPDPEGGIEKTSLLVGIDEPIGIKKGLRPKPTGIGRRHRFRPPDDSEAVLPDENEDKNKKPIEQQQEKEGTSENSE